MERIIESNMVFKDFSKDRIFLMERSRLHKKTNGVKTVEFILMHKKNCLLFVEAKSSSAAYKEGDFSDYERFLDEIQQKFEDSFQLYLAGILERKSGYEDISIEMRDADYAKMNFRFVLIINGHEDSWLLPLKEDLARRMSHSRIFWNHEICVFNDVSAKQFGLIESVISKEDM